MSKNKKIIISIIVIILLIIITSIVISNRRNKKIEEKVKTTEAAVDISKAFEIDDIEKSNLKTTKIQNKEIASKYVVYNNIYELNSKVNFEEISGDMIYVRESYNNLNIFQTTYKINKYDNISVQINNYMNEFERMCTSYLGIEVDEKNEGILYGESKEPVPIPVEESIYNEERLYSKTYTIKKEYEEKERKYDINFYKSENNLVAEFVKIL